MPAVHSSLLERITIDPDVRFGKPCIRGQRITVREILEWLSGGASQEQVLAHFPNLSRVTFSPCTRMPPRRHGFILVSTDSDFEGLLAAVPWR